MMDEVNNAGGILVYGLMLVLFVAVIRRVWPGKKRRESRRSMRAGPGTIGTIYDMLNQDKRRAVELIVEQKAEERRPEYPDGNLPDLEDPRKP